MDYIVYVALAALAASFVVSAVEYWKQLPYWRGFLALGVAALSLWGLGVNGYPLGVCAVAAAFITLLIFVWLERPTVRRR